MTARDSRPDTPHRTALLWTASAVAAAAIALAPGPAAAGPGKWFASVEGNFSFLGQLVSGQAALGSFAYRVAGGYRPSAFEVFAAVEHGFWQDDEGSDRLRIQTLDVGLGVGGTFFDGRARAELTAGASILLTQSQLDGPGTAGFFIDARPAGIRWRVGDHLIASLYPLTFAFVAPVTKGIPLVYVSYRTAVVCELEF
jgi:hypothetical protein